MASVAQVPRQFHGVRVQGRATRAGSPLAARARASATVADEGALLSSAERSIADGDRSGAESRLRAIIDHADDASVRARASLRLAEILLARGAPDEARFLLEPLAFTDAKRADDAIWHYARSERDPRARADAWGRYPAAIAAA